MKEKIAVLKENAAAFIRRRGTVIAIAAAFMLGFAAAGIGQSQPAHAGWGLDLGGLVKKGIKIGGVKLAVDQFGSDLNKVINKLFNEEKYPLEHATKVVIIVSPIGNKHIGAAQVTGPKDAIDRCEAVLALETSFMDKAFRIKGLVPVDNDSPTNAERVPGVGVSAIIDIKL
ncbi:hypothetical protein IT575_04840 [bacterium]|nr:hypothetical protein [bacterium]